MVDYYERDRTNILNSSNNIINPSTEEKQDLIKAALDSIYTAVDELELKLDTIEITADNIELQTDELEAKLEDVKTKLDTLNATDFSTETTLLAFSSAMAISQQAIEDAIASLEASSGGDSTAIVTAINDCCATLEASLTAIEADIEAFKAEAHQDSLDTQAAIDELKAQNGTKHDSIILELQGLDSAFTALQNSNESHSDGEQAAILTAQTAITSALTTLQSSNETHSDEVKAAVEAVDAAVDAFKAAFDGRDLATETTLAAFKLEAKAESDETQALVGEVSATPTANTVMDRLKNIYEAVDGLELSVDNIDLDMEEVEALLTQIDTVLDDINDNKLGEENASSVGSVIARLNDLQINLAAFRSENDVNLTEVTTAIDAFKAAFDARDLATETTQVAAKVEAHADSLAEQAAVDELKAQNAAKHDSIILELQGLDSAFTSLQASNELHSDEEQAAILAAQNALTSALTALQAANDLSGDDIVTEISSCCVTLTAALTTLQTSNETHSDEVKAAVVAVDASVTAFKTAFDVRDLATETTVADFKTQNALDLLAIKDALEGIQSRHDLKDFSTEGTLDRHRVENASSLSSIIAQLEGLPADAYEFSRIKAREFRDTEEVRYDIPAVLINGDIYTAIAADATATSATSWTIIRTYFDGNGNPSRERIRFNVAWDNRTTGW